MQAINKTSPAPRYSGESWLTAAQSIANRIRLRVLEHTLRHRGGYMSQACSSAEMFAALYTQMMNLGLVIPPIMPPPFNGVAGARNPRYQSGGYYNGPQGPHYDRFILSPAQYALILYATLVEVGRMDPDGMTQFNQDGGTVEMIGAEHSPGMEVMTGSLGQGLSQGAGIAMARKRRGESGRVWLMMSDGEFQSGQNWEAVQAAGFHRLDNLWAIVDMNGQQCDGAVTTVMTLEPLAQRLTAFGARVITIDGHDLKALAATTKVSSEGQPTIILAYTDPCRGLPLLEKRIPKLHYLRFIDSAEFATYEAFYQNIRSEWGGTN
ncbi:Transketolase [Gammaproteobacteria bacterium]